MRRAGWWPRAANRFLGKADREAASVMSNAQRHTHFLDSPRIARVLSRSDFHFSELRHRITSVFLVLPPCPSSCSTSLPLWVGGRLEAVERAMGLMAGYGLQRWPILQDMGQLKDLYGERAGTFIANAGVQQVFGVNDFETAKWLSQMMGQETTGYQTDSYRPGDPPSVGNNLTGRDLLTPDEIMQLRPENQLLRVQGQATAVAQKLRYCADREFDGLFVPQDH